MRLRDLIRMFLVLGLLGTMAATVLAAEGDEPTNAAEHPADLAEIVQQLQAENPGLTEAEALELAGIATAEIEMRGPGGREGAALGAPELGGELVAGGNAGPDQGNIVGGPYVERPYLGGEEGRPRMIMTPQEQALMVEVGTLERELGQQGYSPEQIQRQVEERFGERFNEMAAEHGFTPGERDDQRLRELYEGGVPGMERAPGLEHRGGDSEHGRPELGREPTQEERATFEREMERGGFSREQVERFQGGMEREHGGREHGGREFGGQEQDRPTVEFDRPTGDFERPMMEYERPTMEMEHPTVERPAVEYERPTMEQPTYERPTQEHGGSTVP